MREKKRVGTEEGECRRRLSPVRISLAYSRDSSRIQRGTLSVVRSFGKSRCTSYCFYCNYRSVSNTNRWNVVAQRRVMVHVHRRLKWETRVVVGDARRSAS